MFTKRPGHVPGRAVWGLLLAQLLAVPARAQDTGGLLQVLAAPGGVGLMRHARAPGTGDPPGFRLDDCTTQRNLDDAGRDQARRWGAVLRGAGLPDAAVLTSTWCRARETGALLGLRPPSHLDALDSFFDGQGDAAGQTRALRAALDAGRDGPPRILVTHQVNITALTSVFPGDAEMVVLRPGPGGYEVAGRIRPPPP